MKKNASKRSVKDAILLIFKGIAMGAANKVPGVSGGIVAFVAGFYEELIYSLQHFNGKALNLFFNGRFKSFWNYINGSFLSLLFGGSIISYFSISLLLDYWITHYEKNVWGVFLGMVLASLFYITNQVKQWHRKTVLSAFLGLSFGIFISTIKPIAENDGLVFIFFCGIISVSGMTFPGLSGSFLLLVLGNYNLLLVDSVNNLYIILKNTAYWNFSYLDNIEQMRLLKILFVFTFGSIVGLVLFSNILSYLLKKYNQISIATIIGFIAGSARIIWPWKNIKYKTDASGELILNSIGNPEIQNYSFYLPDFAMGQTWIIVSFIILGMGIVILLEIYGKSTENKAIRTTG